MSRHQVQDPRVPEVIKHIKILSRRCDGRPVVKDYLEYRVKHAEHLPAMTTIYRLFGTWPKALAAAGVGEGEIIELSRTPNEDLIMDLKKAAEGLGTKVLSSPAYDAYRREINPTLPPEEQLHSSSVIRKWLGHWSEAVQQAGLETTERSTPHKPTLSDIIEALRKAKKETEGMLTEQRYTEWYEDLTEEEKEKIPEIVHIINQFRDWQQALKAADVEQSDQLHPNGLWTAEEARRIASMLEKLFKGKKINKKAYEQIRTKSSKQLPEWEVLQQLLSM